MPATSLPHSRNLRMGRVSETGRSYLLTCITRYRQPRFCDQANARLLIREMRSCQQDGLIESLAWVVMPDRLHWLLTLQRSSLPLLMKRLKARSSQAINRRNGTQGPLWQAGYHDHALREEDELLATARYVVANPLRAQLVERLGDYPHWDTCWL